MESPTCSGRTPTRSIMVAKRLATGRFALVDDVASGAYEIAAAPREQRRQLIVGVNVAVGEAAAVDDHRLIEQVGVAFLGVLQLLQEFGEQLQVERIDLADLVEHLHVAHVVGERMMSVGDADFRIGARGAFASDHDGGDAGDVGLEGHQHHVGHQPEVVGELRRDTEGLFDPGIDDHAVLRRVRPAVRSRERR